MPNDTPRLANRRQNQTQAVAKPAAAKSSDTSRGDSVIDRRLSASSLDACASETDHMIPMRHSAAGHVKKSLEPAVTRHSHRASDACDAAKADNKILMLHSALGVYTATLETSNVPPNHCATDTTKALDRPKALDRQTLEKLMYQFIAHYIPKQKTTAEQLIAKFNTQTPEYTEDAAQLKAHTTHVKQFFANTYENVATPADIKKDISDTLRKYFDKFIYTDKLLFLHDYITAAFFAQRASLSQLRVNHDVACKIKDKCSAMYSGLEYLSLARTSEISWFNKLKLRRNKHYPLFHALNNAIQAARAAYLSVQAYCMEIIMFNFVQEFLPDIWLSVCKQNENLLNDFETLSLQNVEVTILQTRVRIEKDNTSFKLTISAPTMSLTQMKSQNNLRLITRIDISMLHITPMGVMMEMDLDTKNSKILSCKRMCIVDDEISDEISKLQKQTSVSYVLSKDDMATAKRKKKR